MSKKKNKNKRINSQRQHTKSKQKTGNYSKKQRKDNNRKITSEIAENKCIVVKVENDDSTLKNKCAKLSVKNNLLDIGNKIKKSIKDLNIISKSVVNKIKNNEKIFNVKRKIGIYKIRICNTLVVVSVLGMLCNVPAKTYVYSMSDTLGENKGPDETYLRIKATEYHNINDQLNDLYELVSEDTGLDFKYVKILHQLAGGSAVYDADMANIFEDETLEEFGEPLKLSGSKTHYRMFNIVSENGIEIDRPSAYYLPDALYTVASDIAKLKKNIHKHNESIKTIRYQTLDDDIKSDIDFYEAILKYTGESKDNVENFYNCYELVLNDKELSESISKYESNGEITFKKKFEDIFNNYSTNSKDLLAHTMAFDVNLVSNNTIEKFENRYTIPYKLGETTRENLMLAATSLVGKVRYVWGGGHSGAGFVQGINPVWKQFNKLYPSEPETIDEGFIIQNEGFRTCIKPSGTWCPYHGYASSPYHGEIINSLDEYIKIRSEMITNIDLDDEKYRDMLSTVNYDGGIYAHSIDGLDCSGYVSWVFNQISDRRFNTSARYFTEQPGLDQLQNGEQLLPGDIFAWSTHIVMVVGKVKDNSNAYVTIEQTPNVLRFGVGYYLGASQDDINYAIEVAKQANELFGGINPEYEPPHVYNITCIGNTPITSKRVPNEIVDAEDVESNTDEDNNSEEDDSIVEENENIPEYNFIITDDNNVIIEEKPKDSTELKESNNEEAEDNEEGEKLTEDGKVEVPWYTRYRTFEENGITYADTMRIARYSDGYLDDDILLDDYSKKIKDMTAEEIIQHTIDKTSLTYLSGYTNYNGSIFDKQRVASKLEVENDEQNE